MAKSNKGSERRQLLMENAARSLYNKGYKDTSLRDLAALSGDNVAIFKYYFGGKYELAFAVYADWVNRMFDQMQEACALDARDSFILFNLLELRLCLEDPGFMRLFYELSQEPAFSNSMQNNFVGHIQTHYPEFSPQRAILLALSIVPIKSAIVTYAIDREAFSMNMYADISEETFLSYYLEQLLATLQHPRSDISRFLTLAASLQFFLDEQLHLCLRR